MAYLPAGGSRPSGPRGLGPAPRTRFEPPQREPSSWQPFAVVLFIVVIAVMAWLWMSNPRRWVVGSGILVVPLLVFLTIPCIARARRLGASFDIGGIMAVGLLLRFLAVLHRYNHRLDAGVFQLFGVKLADQFRSLHFDVDLGAPMPGTGGQRYVTGIVNVITNSNEFATFLVFTWLGFLGCYFLYEAFVTAMPDGDRHRYALLVFFWPTLVFWPSSISKDGWMIFTAGIASLGVARVLARQRGGYLLFALGAALASVVRPHVSMIMAVAFGVALLVGRRRAPARSGLTPSGIAKVAGLVMILAIGALLANQLGDFLNARDLSVDSAIAGNAERTAQGGSAFEASNPQNPVGFAKSTVTILFRPFPTEADGIEQLMTSLEALALAGLVVASWRRLASVPFRLRRDPYVAYALSSVLMFIFVLGTIGNFGILARQRTQVIPFFFVLLCVVAPVTGNKNALPIEGTATRR